MQNAKRFSIWAVILLVTCSLTVPSYAKGKKKTKDANAATASDTTADSSKKSEKKEDKSASSGAKVDINNATQKELEELPGVGAATAKKIIQNRPYSDAADLSKAGISQSTITKITPLVTAGETHAASKRSKKAETSSSAAPASASTSNSEPSATTTKGTSAKSSSSTSGGTAADRGTPGNGNVWVNLDTGVYHKEGTRWYGKTKNGKFMNEQDAIKAGYRASKR